MVDGRTGHRNEEGGVDQIGAPADGCQQHGGGTEEGVQHLLLTQV